MVIQSPSRISDLCGTVARMVTLKGSMSTEIESLQVSVLPYRCSICPTLVTHRAPDKRFSHILNSLGRWPRLVCSFHSAQAAPLLEFHVPHTNVLSIGDSVWYMVRNLHCIITNDSVLANSKTHNTFLFPVHATFRHIWPLAVKPASMPRRLVHKKNLERFFTY
jgi:hypothetical protein